MVEIFQSDIGANTPIPFGFWIGGQSQSGIIRLLNIAFHPFLWI